MFKRRTRAVNAGASLSVSTPTLASPHSEENSKHPVIVADANFTAAASAASLPSLSARIQQHSDAASLQRSNSGSDEEEDEEEGSDSEDDVKAGSEFDRGHRAAKRQKTQALMFASSAGRKAKQETSSDSSHASPFAAAALAMPSSFAERQPKLESSSAAAKDAKDGSKSKDGGGGGSLIVPSSMPKKSQRFAPMASKNQYADNISRFDHQPDLCKDFFDTGFCGFGDTCKFIHDRSEVLAFKPISSKTPSHLPTNSNANTKLEVNTECPVCHQSFQDPVSLACKHIYCETCALRRFRQDGFFNCLICHTDSHGSFTKVQSNVKSANTIHQINDDE